MVELDIAMHPQIVEGTRHDGENDSILEFFIVVERRIADVLRPGVASESSHNDSTYYYTFKSPI